MASGTIYGTTSNQNIDVKIEWSSTPDISTNRSTVTASLWYKRNNTGYKTYGQGVFSITIGTDTYQEMKIVTITEASWTKAIEFSTVIAHLNTNGTASVSIKAYGRVDGTTLTGTSISGVAQLDDIPLPPVLDSFSCATQYFSGEYTYKITVKDEILYNRCHIVCDTSGQLGAPTLVKEILLGKLSVGQHTGTVTLSEDELAIIYKKYPSKLQAQLQQRIGFYLDSYSDSGYSTKVGKGTSRVILLYIPSDDITQPTATMTLKPVNSLKSPFDALYIRGKTKVDVDFTNGEGKFGASIKSYNMRVLQQGKYFAAPYTSEYLTTSGTVDVYGYITDSREFTREYHRTIEVIDYASPRILPPSKENHIICGRCDVDGNLTDSGTYLKIRAKRGYSKVVVSGTQYNFCSIRYRYKVDGGSWSEWVTILADNASSDEVTTGALLEGKLSLTSSYVVEIGVVDDFGESDHTTINIPTDKIYMHRSGALRSIGIGKYVEEENTVDIAEDLTTKFRGKVDFATEEWVNLGLSESVSESESNAGRWNGTGCYYRVCAGDKHIYVAFNCAFAYSGDPIQVNKDPIPSAYRPGRNVYALCATGGRSVARILVNNEGNIFVDWIQVISAAEATTSSTVKWIDGYIDYWT